MNALRRPHLVAGLLLLLPSCSPQPATPPGGVQVGGLVREFQTTLDDPLQLHRPQAILAAGDRLYLLDSGNHRVTVTDTLFNLVRRIGGPGSGPGELDMPTALVRLAPGRLAVAEGGNQRISIFTEEGEFVRTLPVPVPHDHPAPLDDTTWVVSGPGGEVGAGLRFGPGGVAEPFGPKEEVFRELPELLDDVGVAVSLPGGPVVALVRPREYRIDVLDQTGERLRSDTFPEPIRRALDAYVEEQEDKWRGALGPVFFNPVKPATPTSQGRVLIPLTLPDPFALVYSPGDGSFVPLHPSGSQRERDLLRRASSGFLDGDRLYLLVDGGISVFQVPGW